MNLRRSNSLESILTDIVYWAIGQMAGLALCYELNALPIRHDVLTKSQIRLGIV